MAGDGRVHGFADGELTPGEREFAAALSALRPARPSFGAAGVHAAALARARRAVWAWRGIAAALAVAGAVAFVARPPRTVERVVYRDAAAAPAVTVQVPEVPAPARLPYLEMRDQVLAHGAAALRANDAAAATPVRVRSGVQPFDF